ncbi:Calcium/proton exchanger [Xylaria bambusicola]|uniref:Calcium/proton exchanger n=1 Tax=Xylaria bambusicola TaxID=326684 RepID=UPI002007D775|nr:Calcium/proton exchanger [Xylaria bambusicola]KAI0525870.1 Calcium/proton exchanger [Xylaria bambusicola]
MDSVNLFKIGNQARRIGRTTKGLKYGWLNPFNHIEYETPVRANTYHTAERGEAGITSAETTTPLHHANTAPDVLETPVRLNTHMSQEGERAAPSDEIYDSQATTAASPVSAQDNQGPRHRRKIMGVPVGRAHSNDTDVLEGKDELKSLKGDFTLKNQLQRTIFSSPINILLLAAPAGIALWALKIPGPAVFIVNFIAIIPLATLLSDATEQVALRTGETIGGLINATFGNAVELIVAIIALVDNQVTVVQTSLVGSVLSNLLLVLGFCFVAGGWNRSEQFFNTTVAQTAASLLALSVASLIVPTIFAHTPDLYNDDAVTSLPSYAVPQLSHGVAVILLLIYFFFLFFQLKTHSAMFSEESQKVPKKEIFKKKEALPENAVVSGFARAGAIGAAAANVTANAQDGNGEPSVKMMQVPTASDDDDDSEEPRLHLFVALGSLTISTVIIALCAEGLVSGIEPISSVVSEEFIGLILVPIVGNACEHATAVTVAMKDKMDLAIGVAIGSSMQVALFLIPLLVIIGWGIGNPDMTLAFDTFQVVTLFVAVLLVNYLIGDGKSHWLEGVQLIALYVIIAVCAFYYPNGTGVVTEEAATALRI